MHHYYPLRELPDYKQIAKKVKGKDIEVTEQEVLDTINYLQKSRAKMSLKNDIAALKDFVEIEYSCDQVEGGKPTKDQFILGEGGMIKGFEDNIIGMKAGEEKTLKVNLQLWATSSSATSFTSSIFSRVKV